MSGGSMDYLYARVGDAVFSHNTPARRAFAVHLEKVAAALRAIEWNDSGDGADNEEELIRACLSPGATLDAARLAAEQALTLLRAELERAK